MKFALIMLVGLIFIYVTVDMVDVSIKEKK
jgi:hypothetical protein